MADALRDWIARVDPTRPDPFGVNADLREALLAEYDARQAYSKDQPRVPAGNPEGGQWTDTAGATPSGEHGRLELNEALVREVYDRVLPASDLDSTRIDGERDTVLGEGYDLAPAHEPDLTRVSATTASVLREAVLRDLARRGADLDEARALLSDWQLTSSGTWTSSFYQRVVERALHVRDAATGHLVPTGGVGDVPDALTSPAAEEATRVVRAEYAATQQFLKDNGITEITVYRGARGARMSEVWADKPLDFDTTITMQPATSWTISKRVAETFAANASGDRTMAHVLTATIPASRILSLPITGRGVLREGEVVLLGGPLRAHVRFTQPREAVWNTAPGGVSAQQARALYDPTQPRVPAGHGDRSGEWTAGPGAGARPVIEHLTDRMRANTLAWQQKTGHTREAMAARIRAMYDRATPAQRREGEQWYPYAQSEAARLAEQYQLSTDTVAGVIAALSPMREWGANLEDAQNLLRSVLTGEANPSVQKLLQANVDKAVEILRGASPAAVLWRGEAGFKVRSFYTNISNPSAPEVTIDTHMLRILLNDNSINAHDHGTYAANAGRYAAFRQAILDVAAEKGVLPSALQATVWVVQKSEQSRATVGDRRKKLKAAADAGITARELALLFEALGVLFHDDGDPTTRALYSPDQPRDPAGTSTGGQWSKGSGSGGTRFEGPDAARLQTALATLPPAVLREAGLQIFSGPQPVVDAKMEEYLLRYYNYSYASEGLPGTYHAPKPVAFVDRARGVAMGTPEQILGNLAHALPKRTASARLRAIADRLQMRATDVLNRALELVMGHAAQEVLSLTNPITAIIEREVVQDLFRKWGWQ